ncbi:UNKNOWN [Stylonychia lemnae]|uniref:EF-hand domain-containing protein n=1 Tax=Stylonychia lemnae TaxID=5949 RepID=A0A078AR44_STYLE|nr:UNKNOWN [Stylonychia lemnae]|eukprot:CDW83717.1 UNKNOWN [Stylonychia lemnae]
MRSTALINNVQRKLLDNDEDLKEKKSNAIEFINKMQQTKEGYQFLLDSAEKAGIYTRKRQLSRSTLANSYYFEHIHDQNIEQHQKLVNIKSDREQNYLPIEEIQMKKKDHTKRVDYYMNVLPDESDFKLRTDLQHELSQLTSEDINEDKKLRSEEKPKTQEQKTRNIRQQILSNVIKNNGSPLKLEIFDNNIMDAKQSRESKTNINSSTKEKMSKILKRRGTAYIPEADTGLNQIEEKSFLGYEKSQDKTVSVLEQKSQEDIPSRQQINGIHNRSPTIRQSTVLYSKKRQTVAQSRASGVSSQLSQNNNQIGLILQSLEQSKAFQGFFLKLAEDDSALRWSKLNRNTFKQFLQDRYGRKISERMITYIEANFGTLYRIEFKAFIRIIRDFIKSGPATWQKFTFTSFNITGNNQLCEHDMFQILEQFRQRDVIYFYKELFNKQQISNNYREACDDSDKIFFDGFNQDFAKISQAFNDKRYQQGKVTGDNNELKRMMLSQQQQQSSNLLSSKTTANFGKQQSISPRGNPFKFQIEQDSNRRSRMKNLSHDNTFITRTNDHEAENNGSPPAVNQLQISLGKSLNNQFKSILKDNESKFDHFKDKSNSCMKISMDDFVTQIKFENNLPQLAMDFIRHITLGIINLREIAANQNRDDKNFAIQAIQKRHTIRRYDNQSDFDLEDEQYIKNIQNIAANNKSIYLITNQSAQAKSQKFVLYFVKQLLKKDYDYVLKSFKDLSANPDEPDIIKIYLTQQSVEKNMGTQIEKDRLVFNFYDYDRDGVLNGLDLLNLVDNFPKGSLIYQEVRLVSDLYVKRTMITKPRQPVDFLKFEKFRVMVLPMIYEDLKMQESIILQELKNKLRRTMDCPNFFEI